MTIPSAARVGNRVTFIAQILLFALIRRLSPLWGRDASVWVFGAREGAAFADNAKYLYLHAANAHPEVRAVWLSADPTVVRALRRRGYEAHRKWSPRGMYLTLRAGAVLVTHGLRDVNVPCAGGALVVYLWHGVPIKTIGWDAEIGREALPSRLTHRYIGRRIDLLTVTAEAAIPGFVSGLRVDPERVVVTGYPRTDALRRDIPGMDIGVDPEARERVRRLADEGRVVAYVPTFREWADEGVAPHLDLAALDPFLAARDAYLVVKTHPDYPLDLDDRACERVVSLPPATDPYPLFRYVDVLVTDYSSILFDFLLLDRPIVCYPYDLERYRDERGFYVAYETVAPGPIARDPAGLRAALDEALGDDEYADERAVVRERFIAPPHEDRSEAVYRTVSERL